MAFRVRTSAKAKRDLDAILGWLLSQEAGDASLRWFQGLSEAIASLATFPERCAFATENASLPYDVRQLLYGRRQNRYRVLVTMNGDTVLILHVRHGRQKALTFHDVLKSALGGNATERPRRE